MNHPTRFTLPLPSDAIQEDSSEQLDRSNPLAVELAGPLFEADVTLLAMTKRVNYTNRVPWMRPWHTFFICLQGTLLFEYPDSNFKLSPGQICFCPADLPYSRIADNNSPVQWIYFRLLDTPLWEPLKHHGYYRRDYESADLFFLLLRRILDAHRSRNPLEINLSLSHSASLLGLLRHELTIIGHNTKTGSTKLDELVASMRANPERNWSVSTMSKHLKVSLRTLNRIFLNQYGAPPHEMLTKLRISKATVSLARGSENVNDIASQLGYQSVYSFSNLFKKHTGMRPTDYRKKFKRNADT